MHITHNIFLIILPPPCYGRGVLGRHITCTTRVDIIPSWKCRSSTFGHRAWALAHALCPYTGYAQYIYIYIYLFILTPAHWFFCPGQLLIAGAAFPAEAEISLLGPLNSAYDGARLKHSTSESWSIGCLRSPKR